MKMKKETRHVLEETLVKMNQRMCIRSNNNGLGSKFPLDDQFLIDPLSDSTLSIGSFSYLLSQEIKIIIKIIIIIIIITQLIEKTSSNKNKK